MQYYQVGKIVNTHGIKGEVKVLASTDFKESRFKPGAKLYLFQKQAQTPLEVTVKTHRKYKQFDMLTFVGLEDINLVEKYKQADLKITADQQEQLAEGEYYYHQIIGLTAITTEGRELGKVKEIMTPGANDVWVIARPKQADLLLPAIADVIKEIRLADGQVLVEMMDGLE